MLEEILSLSKIFIAIPTVTGDEKSLELAVDIAYQDLYDYHVKRFKKNNISSLLYYNTENLPDRFKILLTTNLDVVPAGDTQFKPYIKEGKLYGRGAYDVKAATAAMILAFKETAKRVSYPLGLQIVADGEWDSKSIRYQIEQGVRADFVVSAIPTNFAISHVSKGMLWMKITCKGKSSHSAAPWKGENAIKRMRQFLDIVEKEFPEPKVERWTNTVSVVKIATANEQYNNIPDTCEAFFDIRYLPEDEDIIVEKIKRLMPENFYAEIILNDGPENTPIDYPEFAQLTQAVETITGKKAAVIRKHYADSVRFFKPFGGQGACIGPVGANEHAKDEWVDIQSLADYYEVLKTFLLSVAQ